MESFFCLHNFVFKCHLPFAQVLHIDYGLCRANQALPKGGVIRLQGNWEYPWNLYSYRGRNSETLELVWPETWKLPILAKQQFIQRLFIYLLLAFPFSPLFLKRWAPVRSRWLSEAHRGYLWGLPKFAGFITCGFRYLQGFQEWIPRNNLYYDSDIWFLFCFGILHTVQCC